MLKKLLKAIKNFFFHNHVATPTSYSDEVTILPSKVKQPVKKVNKQPAKAVSKPKNKVAAPREQVDIITNINGIKKQIARKVNKEDLGKRIKENIFVIEEFMAKMESLDEYLSYYNKLQDLKTQSQNSLRILYRMSEEAPYYYNTVKAIVNHTNVIGELLDSE